MIKKLAISLLSLGIIAFTPTVTKAGHTIGRVCLDPGQSCGGLPLAGCCSKLPCPDDGRCP
jgi:hypothetical protein